MATYNFDKTVTIGRYEVNLCTDKAYGCFEDVEHGGEGGLWFEHTANGLALCDYDGYFELPKQVVDALKGFGCDTSYVED
jgi:hypothetical protein